MDNYTFLILSVSGPTLDVRIWRLKSVPALNGLINHVTGRAPVYSYLSSTVHGLHVIRAHDRQQHMMGCLHKVQNVHSSAWFTYFNCHRWLALRVEWSTLVFMAGCLGTSFFIKERGMLPNNRLGPKYQKSLRTHFRGDEMLGAVIRFRH